MLDAKKILAIAYGRGLRVGVRRGLPVMPVVVRPDGVPASEVTPALLSALKAWRVEIIAELTAGAHA